MQNPKQKNIAVSGQDCPLSGVWQAQGAVLPPLLVPRGHIMPGVQGRVVTWVFLEVPAPEPGNQP